MKKLDLGCVPLFLAFLLFSSCAHETKVSVGPRTGLLQLEDISFDSGSLVNLNVEWHFWKDQLLDPADVRIEMAAGRSELIKVPSLWSKLGLFQNKDSLSHTGTLALELALPITDEEWAIRLPNANSACALFIDDTFAANIGCVSSEKASFIPNNGVEIVPFYSNTGKVLLVWQVANFSTPYTGTWDSPRIGLYKFLARKRFADLVFASLISGAMIFMGLYHLALFALRRKDKSTLVFGIACLCMSARNLIMGERILIMLFPLSWGGWQAAFTLEHLSAHMVLPLFFIFFKLIFPRQLKQWAVSVVVVVSALWAILEITTPALFHHRLLPFFEYFLILSALYLIPVLVQAFQKKEEGSGIVIIGFAIMMGTAINDVLFSNGIIQSFYMASIGLFFFLFSQSFFISLRFATLFNMVERIARELQQLNQSLERFIPHEMLGFLNKNSILDVELGDYSEQFMSVFFLDIRDFTSISETMTPEENFRFINTFLEVFGPIVRENGGFIDKYLGDGFMALFPGHPDSALDAALSMRHLLVSFNSKQENSDLTIRFGIGIHSGMLMLGTIGENQRMDSTVISDTVNTASRLEQLTKTLGADILISAETIEKLQTPSNYTIISRGSEKVKGRARSVEVFAVENLILEELVIEEL